MEIISAQSPVNNEYLIGSTEVEMFDERGGVFHSYKHGVSVIVPEGAIPSGVLAELKFAATLVAPVKFATNKTLVSAVYWLCMEVVLQKPIQLRLPRIFQTNETQTLQFAKLCIHHIMQLSTKWIFLMVESSLLEDVMHL